MDSAIDLASTQKYGISNKQYAAVAGGSLALAAFLVAGIRAGYAAVDAASAAAAAEVQAAAAAVQLAADEQETAAMETSPAVVTDMSGTEAAVARIISGHGDNVAVSVRMLDGSGSIDINGDEPMQSASMIKLLVLAEYLDEVDSGELLADETYTLDGGDVVGGSGTMQDDPVGSEYTLDEVAHRMVAVSDNIGTNVLIGRMGVEAIQQKATELGLGGTNLAHKLMLPANDGSFNMISANDACRILERVASGTLASKGSCERAEDFLLDQEDDEGLAQGLPADVAFGHKTGTVDGIRHDGGIVYAEHPYVICVLTRGLDYGVANALMAQVSAAVYEALE